MASLATAYTRILMSTKELKKGIDKSVRMTKEGAGKMSKSFRSVGSAVFSLQSAILGGAGAAGLVYGLKKLSDAAKVQIDAEKKLKGVLDATGQSAGLTFKELTNMASGLQQVTNFGDEATISAQAILLTFKNIKKDAFEPTLKAAMDMSVVMGQDLKQSVIQLGKAMNDPATQMSALARTGVTFTEVEKDMVKEMMKVNDIAGAQTLILEALEGQFGGAAEAAADIFTQTSNVFGDIKEKLGIVVREGLEPVVRELKGWLEENDKLLAQNLPEYISAVTDAADKLLNVFQKLAEFTVKVGDALTTSTAEQIEKLKEQREAWQESLDFLNKREAGRGGWFGGLSELVTGDLDRSKIADLIKKIKEVDIAILDLERTTNKADETYGDFGKSTDGLAKSTDDLGDALKNTAKDTKEFAKELEKVKDLIIDDYEKIWKQIEQSEERRMKAFKESSTEQIRATHKMINSAGEYKKAIIEREKAEREAMRAAEQSWRDGVRQSNDFFEGMKMGWADILAAQVKWGEEGEILVKEFFAMTQYTLGESLFEGITGNWSEMGEVWKDLLDDMLRYLAHIVAKMIAEFALLQALQGIFGAGLTFPGVGGGIGLGGLFTGAGVGTGATIIGAGGTSIAAGGVAGMTPAGAGLGGVGAGSSGITAALAGISWSTILAGAGIGVILTGVLSQVFGERTRPMNEWASMREQFEVGSDEYNAITNQMRENAGGLLSGGQNFDREGNLVGEQWDDLRELINGDFTIGIEYDQNFDRIMGNISHLLERDDQGLAIEMALELVDNVTIPMQQKMEALGMVGSEAGWTSDATIQMIAQMIDTGIPWGTINETLVAYGVEDDEVIKEIIGHYTDEGMTLEDLQYMLEESGVPERLLREIMTTVEPVVADQGSFNNFEMEYSGIHSLGYHGPSSLNVNYQGHQFGGDVRPGEVSWVGEAGPELAFFPKGARIYSHGESMNMANSKNGGSSRPINVHVSVGGEEFTAYISNISDDIRVRAERAIEGGQPRTRRL